MSEETGNELVVLQSINPVAVFGTEGGSQKIIDGIKDQVSKLSLDISTEKGRKEIASVAYKIARTKTALDDEGKKLKADMQKTVDLVDAERKNIRDALDELKESVRKPLTDWENVEKMRIRIREERIEQLLNLATPLIPDPDVETIDAHLAQLKETEVFDWQEFSMRAEHAAKQSRDKLDVMRAARVKRDEEAVELERLRKEKEEREQKEREEKIAAEAAAKAKADAEAKAAADAKAAQEKADREKREAYERAENERREKEAAQQRAEKAEADKKAADEKAEADSIAAAKKAEEDAKVAADKAAQDERDRQAAEERRKADEAAKRAADEKHRGKINREVLAAVMQNANLTETQGKAVVTSLSKGLIPHTKINY